MPKGFFITGTDTGVGKTLVSAALLHKLNEQGLKTVAMKPLASGCINTAEGLRNEDALLLQQTASVELHYKEVNPYAFEPAIAPHIAAQKAAVNISLDELEEHFSRLAVKGDAIIVEGVGGWHVPVSDQQTMVDLAKRLGLPVIMVVGMRLGCLNHALLTVQAIENDGLHLAGWVANVIDTEMPFLDENIDTLKSTLFAKFLGKIPYISSPQTSVIAGHFCLP